MQDVASLINDVAQLFESVGLRAPSEYSAGTYLIHWTRVGSENNYIEAIFVKKGYRDVATKLAADGWLKQQHFRSRTGLADHYQRFHNADRRCGVFMYVFWFPISEDETRTARQILDRS